MHYTLHPPACGTGVEVRSSRPRERSLTSLRGLAAGRAAHDHRRTQASTCRPPAPGGVPSESRSPPDRARELGQQLQRRVIRHRHLESHPTPPHLQMMPLNWSGNPSMVPLPPQASQVVADVGLTGRGVAVQGIVSSARPARHCPTSFRRVLAPLPFGGPSHQRT
jgi:hypothetical protein